MNTSLSTWLTSMASTRVVVIGDVMLDRFISGVIERISPEAPVPVLSLGGETNMPGGAGNVARNLAHLGCLVDLIGITGSDDNAAALKQSLELETAIKFHGVVDRTRPTTVKSRYTATGQQVLRVDSEDKTPISDRIMTRVLKSAERCFGGADMLIISDYNKGMITDELARKLIALARKHKIKVLVDPKKHNAAVYARADLITPNLAEMNLLAGEKLSTPAAITAAAREIMNAHKIDHILTTMSGDGMMLASRKGDIKHVSALAKSVFDVSGAGDTVIATMAAILAAGGTPGDAIDIANAAAGVVVGKSGTATVTPGEILAHMTGQYFPDQEDNLSLIKKWRADNSVIGFTNGCFDRLHPGHIKVLEAAAKTCDRLVVGLNSDASTRQLKGDGRPFQDETTRAAVLASLPMVDAVMIFDEKTPARLIRSVQPDRLIKGGDYDPKKVVGRDTVIKRGGKVVIIPLREGYSTTRLAQSPSS